jgi:uncharacterized membrane protein YdbT with pleckstrin-like domain
MSIFDIFRHTEKSFEGQEAGERVILIVRKHPFTIYARLAVFLLLAIAPIIGGVKFYKLLTERELFEIFLFASSLWYMMLWLVIFYTLTMYTLNIVAVTDKRIIDSEQHSFFSRKVSELHISRIQDVSVRTTGFLQTVFHFGDLVVQTAAAEREFTFTEIPHPENIKNVIMRAAATKHHGVSTLGV